VIQTSTDATISSGEDIFLQKTGANQASSDIRDTIDAETDQLAEENTSTFDKIIGKAGAKVDTKTTVVDPAKEIERIRANKAAGAPITQGETPTKEQ